MSHSVNMGGAINGIVSKTGTAAKLNVVNIDASVDNVAVRASTRCAVVDVRGAGCTLVGNTSQAPWRVILRLQIVDVPDLVLLDMGNL